MLQYSSTDTFLLLLLGAITFGINNQYTLLYFITFITSITSITYSYLLYSYMHHPSRELHLSSFRELQPNSHPKHKIFSVSAMLTPRQGMQSPVSAQSFMLQKNRRLQLQKIKQ